jgi:hypothetical protein
MMLEEMVRTLHTAQYSAQYYTVHYTQHSTLHTVQYSVVQNGTHSAVQCSTLQYSTVQE